MEEVLSDKRGEWHDAYNDSSGKLKWIAIFSILIVIVIAIFLIVGSPPKSIENLKAEQQESFIKIINAGDKTVEKGALKIYLNGEPLLSTNDNKILPGESVSLEIEEIKNAEENSILEVHLGSEVEMIELRPIITTTTSTTEIEDKPLAEQEKIISIEGAKGTVVYIKAIGNQPISEPELAAYIGNNLNPIDCIPNSIPSGVIAECKIGNSCSGKYLRVVGPANEDTEKCDYILDGQACSYDYDCVSGKCENFICASIEEQLAKEGKIGCSVLKSCKPLIYNGDIKEKLDVVFLPINYSDLTIFYNDVDMSLYLNDSKGLELGLDKRGLFLVEPFKSNQKKFNIYVIEDSCLKSDLYWNIVIKMVLNSCPYTDEIIAIVDDPVGIQQILETGEGSTMAGHAYTDRTIKYPSTIGLAVVGRYDIVYGSTTTVAHEFSHSFGLLGDEYITAGDVDGPTDKEPDIPNCAVTYSGNPENSCPKWKDIPNTGCYPGCTFKNWYRPSKTSLLGCSILCSLREEFNSVSVKVLEDKLKQFK